MDNNIPLNVTQPTEPVKRYHLQHVIDASPTLKIKRNVLTPKEEIIKLATALFELVKDYPKEVEWDYNCQQPDRFKEGGDNAPSYIPDEPKDIAKWIIFQSLEGLIDDSYSRAVARSRARDKELRAPNIEKFDDETFCTQESYALDKATKEELMEQRDNLIVQASTGKDKDGNPLNLQEVFDAIKKLMARIDAKSRK